MGVVLITGCASGFGYDLVGRFLSEGHQVIATMRNLAQRETLFSDLKEKYKEKLTLVELDITLTEQRKNLIARLEWLDILVNNAGFGLYGALEDMEEEQIRHQMEVNFFGTALMIKDCLYFLRQSKGKIINISSILGRWAMPLSAMYSASKFSIEGLTEGLAYELEPMGVQICNVCPGRHQTHFIKNVIWAGNSEDQPSIYSCQVESIKGVMKKLSQGKEIPLSNVTRKIVLLSQKKRIPIRVYVGNDAMLLNVLHSFLPDNFSLNLLKKVYSFLIRKRKYV